MLCTEAYKAYVVYAMNPYAFPTNGSSIFCNKGILPLKISWDLDQLNSDSLPFPSQFPHPRGQGNLYFDGWHVKARENFVQLVDNNGYLFICDSCLPKDSVVLFNIFGQSQTTNSCAINFEIAPWGSAWLNVNKMDIESNVNFKIYEDKIYLICKTDINIEIYDLLGKELYNRKLRKNINISIPLIHQGILLVKIYNDDFNKTYKIFNHD